MHVNEYTPALLFKESIEELSNKTTFKSDSTEVHPRWKKILNTMEPIERREFFIQSINQLQNDKNQTEKILTLCLRVLQDLAFSPRVSNLNSLKYYLREVNKGYQHPLLLKGTKTFLRALYPEETIHFISAHSKVTIAMLPTDQKSCYIVLQPENALHQSLMRISNANSTMYLQIFDSLGYAPFDPIIKDELHHTIFVAMKRITRLLSQNGTFYIDNIFVPRQKDFVNCSSFICEDIRTAIHLLRENKPLFVGEQADLSFYKISQNTEHIKSGIVDPELIKAENADKKLNIKATLIAMDIFEMFINTKVEFPPANYTTEEVSEQDTENCIIA